jgi:hypothetical protein
MLRDRKRTRMRDVEREGEEGGVVARNPAYLTVLRLDAAAIQLFAEVLDQLRFQAELLLAAPVSSRVLNGTVESGSRAESCDRRVANPPRLEATENETVDRSRARNPPSAFVCLCAADLSNGIATGIESLWCFFKCSF